MSALKICPQCGTEYELDQRFCPKDGSTLRSQASGGDLVGTIIADRYHVLKKLGEGGMGQVYLAEHVKMGRKSAVKVMNPGMVNDADAISRFNREAANASRINHPNVAAVYDFGETSEGIIYLAMEFVEGPSLTSLLDQQGALPPLRAADITRQAGDALAVAHDMGIVHRDLKPDNIMIAKNRDGTDCVKVVDFGIAKAANNDAQKVTKTGLVVGMPEYMSPEQLAGDKLDGRSDIYSLGLVAFNMLTGRLPFPAETIQESMIMRLTDRPKRLSEMRPEVAWTPDVQGVLDRALERDAGARYQTAHEFGRDLYKAIGKMPISAAGEVGTQVLGVSVPPTRVGSEPGGAGRSSRSGPGGTAVGVSPAGAPATSSAARAPASFSARSKLPFIGIAAAAIVVLGVGTAILIKKAPAAPTSAAVTPAEGGAPTTTQPLATQQTPALPPNAGAESTTTPARKRESGTKTSAARPQTKPVPPPSSNGGRAAPAEVSFALDRLEPLTDPNKGANPATAQQLLTELDKLHPQIQNNEDFVHYNLLRAEADILLDKTADACDLLKEIEGKSNGTSRGKRVRALLQAC